MKELLLISTYVAAWMALFMPLFVHIWKRIFSKIDFSPFRYCQVTFNEAGPILDVMCSVLGYGFDQSINKISVKVRHQETEQAHNFEWLLFMPTILPLNKNNPQFQLSTPQFLKVGESINMNVRLVDPSSHEQFMEKTRLFAKDYYDYKLENFINPNDFNSEQEIEAYEEFKGTDTHRQFYEYLKDNFFWKVGEYSADIIIDTGKNNRSYQYNYKFSLSEKDVDLIKLNCVGVIMKICTDDNRFFLAEKKLEKV